MANKRKIKQTLGAMSNSRMTWGINPVTRVKPSRDKYKCRTKAKQDLRSGKWDD